jgi:hypothetical protein
VLGDDRDLAEAVLVHRPVVGDRQRDAVEHDAAADETHAPVEPDQALAEGGLAAAGLAGQAHDLAVRDGEAHVVERLHVAAQRPVVDTQIRDRERHRSRSLGLKTSSRPTFIT